MVDGEVGEDGGRPYLCQGCAGWRGGGHASWVVPYAGERRRRRLWSAWTAVAGARGQARVPEGVGEDQTIQGRARVRGRGSRARQQLDARGCNMRALAALWTRAPRVRPNASGIYRDPTKLKINRVVLVWKVRMMDMLARPEDQVSNVVRTEAKILSCT